MCQNKNYTKLGIEPLESSIRKKIGKVIPAEEISSINKDIEDLLARTDDFKNTIQALRKDLIYNFGEADKAGAKEIRDFVLSG